MHRFHNIDPLGLDEMRRTRSCELIDVRTDEEVQRGMIAGARHIPLHALASRLQEITSDCPVVFYCQSGARSMQASAFLAGKGYFPVYNLTGGVMAWARSGLPLVSP